MMRSRVSLRLIGALVATVLGIAAAAAQSAPSDYYKGKTLTIIVGTPPGGGYDGYARLLGRYMGRHLPGTPNVVVAEQCRAPVARWLRLISHVSRRRTGPILLRRWRRSHSVRSSVMPTKLNYDPIRVNYLGSAMSDIQLCFVGPEAPAQSFEDMFKTEVMIGGTQAKCHRRRGADPPQQCPRHEVQGRVRLSGIARDHSGDAEGRNPRHVRHRLDRP